MPYTDCVICELKFYAKPKHLKIGWGKYCSKKCQGESQKTGKFTKCEVCLKKIYRSQGELNSSKSKKYFCSKSCACIWKNRNIFYGDGHANWNGGKSSYREAMLRGQIPMICSSCGIDNKRVLLVHYVDGNRENNKIKNLCWLCRNCHYLIHDGKTV